MNDMTQAIVPKSDQLNADDLIAGPITITVTEVTIRAGEQPVSIHYEGDNGKPYKSCKSMNRLLVMAWGPDAKAYIGRSMTLYRDPGVKWAGQDVGGIRISHLSDIPEKMTVALTATKGQRKPFTVHPLLIEQPATLAEALVAIGNIKDDATKQSAIAVCNRLTDDTDIREAKQAMKAKLAAVREGA
jgi:hypothetical protein